MKTARLLLTCCACATVLRAQEPVQTTDKTAVQIVTYLDLLPTQSNPGRGLLVRQARAEQAFAGCLSARLIQEQGRPNHFMLVESWRDLPALDAYRAAGDYRRFRTELQPALASPLDEHRGQQIVP